MDLALLISEVLGVMAAHGALFFPEPSATSTRHARFKFELLCPAVQLGADRYLAAI